MKKNLLFLLLLAAFSFNVLAGTVVPKPIVLRPRPTFPQPHPLPFSEEGDIFSLYATTDALELTSESAQGTAFVSVTGPTGVVYSSMESMTIGSELFISVEDFPAGAYTISILYNATIYVGEFEVE